MLFERVFRELNKRKIKYLVVGGIAVNLHGFSRTTGDLDLMLSFDTNNLKKFVQMVKFLGLIPTVPVAVEDFMVSETRNLWEKEKNMKVFSVFNPKDRMEHVDVLIHHDVDFEKAYKNREDIPAVGLKIPVIAINDLIKMKKVAGRERDKIDIKALREIIEIKDEKKKK